MESQWLNLLATKIDDHDHPLHNNAGSKVDLTLKLGLPNSVEKNNQTQFDLAPSQPQEINHYEMVNQVMNANANIASQSLNADEIAWQSKLGSQFHAQYMQPNGHGFGPFAAGSSSMAPPLPMYTNPYYNNFNMNPNPNPNPNFLLPPTPTMNHYTLLDIPARRAIDREFGSSSTSRRNSLRRQRGGSYIDPYKRCTNYNCNTNDTPMWRKGPLGPKTLCNACGIKYRKEEERRKAKEEAKGQHQSNNEFG